MNGFVSMKRPRLHLRTIFHVTFLPLTVLVTACGNPGDDAPPTILVSGDTTGRIVPCGCTTNQSGGLLRRGTFVEQCRRNGPVVPVDVGGAPGGRTVYDRLKFDAILQGENLMDLAAHNIGRAEAELGPGELRRLHEVRHVPWISANTTDDDGRPLAEPARLVVAGGKRLLFIGILSQKYQTETVRVSPPRQAVLYTLKDHAGQYDHAVVLAYVPEEELRELVESLPEVDAVVGGPTGQPLPPTWPQGSVLATSATSQGKFLAVLTPPAPSETPARFHGKIVELDESFDDDPRQTANLHEFYDTLRRRDLSPDETPFVEPQDLVPTLDSGNSVAGTESCRNCHENEARTWADSRHARSWESLLHREARYDPDCQRCHVTGYGRPGGFESIARSNDRFHVGCESCHGPSSGHVQKTTVPTSTAARAAEQCRRCHDEENSPRFDFDVYWPKIRHGNLDDGN